MDGYLHDRHFRYTIHDKRFTINEKYDKELFNGRLEKSFKK